MAFPPSTGPAGLGNGFGRRVVLSPFEIGDCEAFVAEAEE